MIRKVKKILLKRFSKNYWQSDISRKWHKKRLLESYDDFNLFSDIVCKYLKNLDYDTVVEIGTAGGALINLIAQKLPNYNKFIGMDINKNQIAENNKIYKDVKNLEFIYVDILDYIKSNKVNDVAIVAQNTLGYFSKHDLEKLFLLISNNIKNFIIIANTSNYDITLNDTIDREEADLKVYRHNYLTLFKSIGLEVDIKPYCDDKNNIIIFGYKKENEN